MNRYGRHGPHAWLRMRERRIAAFMPTTQTLPVVIHPAPLERAERIIIIMVVQRGYSDEDDNKKQEMRYVESHASSQIDEPAADKKAKKEAIFHATLFIEDLISEFKDNRKSAPFIPQRQINRAAREKSNVFMDEHHKGELTLPIEEYKRLRNLFKDTFISACELEIEEAESEDLFLSENNIQLHDAALQDKKISDPISQPELNVISTLRAVLASGLTLHDALIHFENMAELASVYQKYYQTINPETEVLWADQDPF